MGIGNAPHHLSTMTKYTPILKQRYLWKIILPLKWLFSTSLGPKVQFSLFIFPSRLLLTGEHLSNTGGNLIKILFPLLKIYFTMAFLDFYGAMHAATILIPFFILFNIY